MFCIQNEYIHLIRKCDKIRSTVRCELLQFFSVESVNFVGTKDDDDDVK